MMTTYELNVIGHLLPVSRVAGQQTVTADFKPREHHFC